jgi:hypothetical protein
MPGDYSRETFNRKKHYSDVRMQQGRVQLDADWNEQGDIQRYRIETEAIDVIGRCGVPLATDGFKIEAAVGGDDLTISPGRIYVDGLLLELDEQSTYTTQPSLPRPEFTTLSSPPSGSPPGSDLQLTLNSGTYLVYLDAWQLERTALDDREIREVALGGPDTTTRLQNIWQVKLLKVGGISSPPASPPTKIDCEDSFPEFDALTTPSTGQLNVRTAPPKDEDNVCLLPPGAGYSGFENQLYRVEVHTGGTRAQATFKFSRNNASFETNITDITDDVITVADLGKDEVLNFVIGQWVEVVSDEASLKGEPNPLVQIDNIVQATNEITVKPSAASFAGIPGLKLRAWDQTGADAGVSGIEADLASFIDLESGIQVNFSTGLYHSGDYWLIPARTATGDIEWPRDDSPGRNPIAQPPKGIAHHFCRLALVEVSGGVTVIDDCRKLFPPLTELIHFFYVGGAGQEAMPGQSLPCPLQVGLTNGQFPVPGARVTFALVAASAGTLHAGADSGASLTVLTNEEGVAACTWELGQAQGQGCMQVEANLLGAGDKLLQPPIRFNANFSIASQVAYDPSKCDDLKEAHTVQQAIDLLCRQKPKEEPGIRIEKIFTSADNAALVNDTLVAVNRLLKGIVIVFDRPVSLESFGSAPANPESKFSRDAIAGKPTCFMMVDLPYPLLDQESFFWAGNDTRLGVFGFQPFIVACNVHVKDRTVTLIPTQGAMKWLQDMLFQALLRRKTTDRVLAHLTLKGKFIFGEQGSKLYLDGEAFGRATANKRVELILPSGDGRKGGDFDMWFWLTPPLPTRTLVTNLSATVTGGGGLPRGISGSVRDSEGAAVSNVQVSLLGQATGITKTALTDEQGNFVFPNLTPDIYKVSVKVGEASAEQTVNVGR